PVAEDAPQLPPTSPLWVIKPVSGAGNGVFALQHLPDSTALLSTSFVPMYTINREYRREVCGYCFLYDDGKNLRIRNSLAGFSFCSLTCQNAWNLENGLTRTVVWEPLETYIKKRHGKSAELDELPNADDRRPSPLEISNAWEECSTKLALVRPGIFPPCKDARGARHAISKTTVHPDTLSFLASGHHALSGNGLTSFPPTPLETSLRHLAQSQAAYPSAHDLALHTIAHLQLAMLLNLSSLTTRNDSTQLSHTLTAVAACNAFGLRPPVAQDPDRSEYFGWGLWPEASFFNHSCEPNVAKERVGREWRFWAAREVRQGEELCISYLGGEEGEMTREERQGRLKVEWGFECCCARCE
ncbi:SET domain-containing protein, partial [Eremomyces bilateralis CBS 781.70]